ncbi:hypothetical protein ABZW18_10190 [Streptomyces sp. NPDC004647]
MATCTPSGAVTCGKYEDEDRGFVMEYEGGARDAQVPGNRLKRS